MLNSKIQERLKQNSVKDSAWRKGAKFRKDNRAWLDISFEIAVIVASVLSSNKRNLKTPMNQKELAEVLGTSPQYVNKILKGKEKLNIETITKLEAALEVGLIKVIRPTRVSDFSYYCSELASPRKSVFSYDNIISGRRITPGNFIKSETVKKKDSYNANKYIESIESMDCYLEKVA